MSKLITLLLAAASLAAVLAISAICPTRPDLGGLGYSVAAERPTLADLLRLNPHQGQTR